MHVMQIWIVITAYLDMVFLFLIPYLMLINGVAWPSAILAGVCLGAYQPTITSYHELHHRVSGLKLFEKMPFYFGFSSYLLGIIDVVHRDFHHKHANTQSDISHPMTGMSYYQNVYNYYFRYFYKTFNTRRWQVGLSITGFVALAIFQYYAFGINGVLFQLTTTLTHHWSVTSGNYCQHYGLERLNVPQNQKARFAWDNKGEFARYNFFNFHRHSGHHANAGMPSQKIQDDPTMLRNPLPLPLMMVIAMYPPLFKKISQPRLDAFLAKYEGKSHG